MLQSCLKSLYITWVAGTSYLEPLISELLTKVTLPPINCLPFKRPFGALRELVLHPIHEETSLPYTSTAALKLLQSIGEDGLYPWVSYYEGGLQDCVYVCSAVLVVGYRSAGFMHNQTTHMLSNDVLEQS